MPSSSVSSAPVIGRIAERLQRLRHLHRAVEAVVVGEREGAVALLGRRPGQLDRMRRAVEERVGGVAVELDVRHEHMFAYSTGSTLRARHASCRRRRFDW